MARAVLPSSQFIKWSALYKEDCRAQAERNQAANPPVPITYGMLSGTGDRYSMGTQQAALPAPYQDQVRALGLAAWRKLEEGPTESPIGGIQQNREEDLPQFIDRVEKSLSRKLPAGALRDQFVKLVVWDRMTPEHRSYCSGLKESSMSCWVVATRDIRYSKAPNAIVDPSTHTR